MQNTKDRAENARMAIEGTIIPTNLIQDNSLLSATVITAIDIFVKQRGLQSEEDYTILADLLCDTSHLCHSSNISLAEELEAGLNAIECGNSLNGTQYFLAALKSWAVKNNVDFERSLETAMMNFEFEIEDFD